MRTILVLAVLGSLALLHEANAKNCFCPLGFEATIYSSGEANCLGLWNKMGLACSQIEPPKCECHGDANAVSAGPLYEVDVRCINTETNKNWPCENDQEWKVYKEEREREIREGGI